MLRKIGFKNFKVFKNIDLSLSPFTILIGPNGVGKSTILNGIQFVLGLVRSANPEPVSFFGGQQDYFQKHQGPSGEYMSFSIQKDDVCVDFDILTEKKSISSLKLSLQNGNEVKVDEMFDKSKKHSGSQIYALPTLKNFPYAVSLNLNSSAIASPSAAAPTIIHLDPDGKNLPTVLSQFVLTRDGTIEKIEDTMKKIIPGFERIVIEPSNVGGIGYQIAILFANLGKIPAAQLSEGTLLLLAIITLLHSPACPRLLLIDDLDRALHPGAQVELVDLLRRLVSEQGDLQIIATAHSPVIVSRCAKEEVVVLRRNSDGSTDLAHPDDAPGLLSTSELLSRYFSLPDTLGAAGMLQEYALYAEDPRRTDQEDATVHALARRLRALGVEPFPITPRRPQ